MDLVSRKEFFKLAAAKGIALEGDYQMPKDDEGWFEYDKDFLPAYYDALKQAKEEADGDEIYGIDIQDPYERAKEIVEHNWIFETELPVSVAEGSSRIAYRYGESGHCLKMAKNKKGIAQNRQEVKNCGKSEALSKYPIFTKTFDYDDKEYGSILTEYCTKAAGSDFEKLFKISFQTIYEFFDQCFVVDDEYNMFNSIDDARAYYEDELGSAVDGDDPDELDCAREMIKLCDGLEMRNPPAHWKVLRSLYDFYYSDDENKRKLSTGDLSNIDNWGLAIRFGKICPIIIDAGLSEDVWNDYYKE